MKKTCCIATVIILTFSPFSNLAAQKVVVVPLGGTTEIEASINWKGQWSATELYHNGDGVEFNGSSYLCVGAPACTLTPPGKSWDLMAAKGNTGDTGARGYRGDTGTSGPKGNTGMAGPKGDTGAQGATGATGPTGPKGDTGAQGSKGNIGNTGPKGDTGAQGSKGDTGDAGPKGDIGNTGSKGDTGDKGDTGTQGPKGDTGAQGLKGDKGDKGDTGSGGGSIIAKDNGGVVLGKVLSVIDYALKILTSTGNITELDWAGNPDVTYTYFTGDNCTGTVFKYASSQYPTNDIHWGYLPSNLGVPVPYTLSEWQGAKTPKTRTKENTNGTCDIYTTVRDNTYTLTQTTRTAIGLPDTIAGPIVVEEQ